MRVAALLLVLAAGLGTARAAPVVPRDEPAPAPDPADLPDYGPQPAAAAAAPVPPLELPETPRFKLTWSRFTAHRLGGQDQPFDAAGVTFYLVSSWLRVGATTRLGVEEAQAGAPADWFLDEVGSVGLQLPGVLPRVVPFVDVLAGFGFRMYKTFNNSLPSFTWCFGLQAGAEVYLTRRAYLSLAAGWLRPVVSVKSTPNPTENEQILDVYSDTFMFTVGIGL
jgi:hypothetical protein